MKETNARTRSVLLSGSGSLTCSIAVCLLKAGHVVDLYTDKVGEAETTIAEHFGEMKLRNGKEVHEDWLHVSKDPKDKTAHELAILITEEDLSIKKDLIRQLENLLPSTATIAVNSESIGLDAIQENALHPERIIGLNWTEPAHTTQFLEIITNASVKEYAVDQIKHLSASWGKDPYVVKNFGIRSRLMSAMVREAFYLVENGYATVEDIDRACRNDAGYYLPFAGNCRYMDLMGTYAYGMVMKDLNPDLSKDQELPKFFTDIIKEDCLGMQNGKGLYQYTPAEVKQWQKIFAEFSYQIEKIIKKYPFNYSKTGVL